MGRLNASTNRGRVARSRASTRPDYEEAELQIPTSSGYCAICNLAFGSRERRVLWHEQAAHLACARRVRGVEVA